MAAYVHLRCERSSVVLTDDDSVPRVLHWGAPLPPDADLAALDGLDDRPLAHGTLDVEAPLGLVPERSRGWSAAGGLDAHRPDGTGWSPRFTRTTSTHDGTAYPTAGADGRRGDNAAPTSGGADGRRGDNAAPTSGAAEARRHDDAATSDDAVGPRGDGAPVTSDDARGGRYSWRGADAGLALTVDVVLDEHGVLRVRAEVVNQGDDVLHVQSLAPVLPLPPRATEAMSLTGRWTRELQEQRHAITAGALVLENRTGRTGHESAPSLFVGTPGFSHERGEVWAAHLAWSGNHHVRTEVLSDGRRTLSLAELLLPGELRLAPGAAYTSPDVLAAYSRAGLNGVSDAFHAHVRARPDHPRSPRPVLLNTWEAVYMQHDLDRLRALADAAAAAGVERFVLDDGWFRGRDDDTSSLGDWYVDERKHPDGLAPLIDHVRGLGMDFGLWVEPEMVSIDSDLFRAHPGWALGIAGHEPLLGRHQLVLDLARPEVSAYLLERLDALLAENDVAFLKWDMNRDLADAGRADGSYAGHAQTVALYALLAELRRRHPAVEIESCASGGGRIDLGIAAFTQRFWASDCNDPLERQSIQRGFSYLLPPELMGAHVGGPWAHTTARTSTLPFRGATALFGHLGVEWNLADAPAHERGELRGVVEAHRRLRPLLHGGRVVRVDHPDPAAHVHGVVAHDRSEALFCYAQLTTSASTVPLQVRLPGLDPGRTYRLERLLLPGAQWDPGRRHPRWYDEPLDADGAQLGEVGVPLGVHLPEMATLLHLRTSP